MHNRSYTKYNKSEMYLAMKLSDLNPFIRYARAHRVQFPLQNAISICYDCRIFFFDNISGSITVNGENHPLYNKTALFLPPETKYRMNILFKENAQVIILNFDLTCQHEQLATSLGTATEATFEPRRVPPYTLPKELSTPIISESPQTEHLLTQCVEHFLCEGMYYRECASALLKLCLLDLLHRNALGSQSELCKDVLAYIHSHYSDTAVTNRQIAAKFGYHPDYLSTLIRQETGKSLHKYLIAYRLQMAKNYLLTTQYDISEIAWRCGFCTPAYFIKLFRENTSMTPSAYRKSI